jgi:hypothetical protein
MLGIKKILHQIKVIMDGTLHKHQLSRINIMIGNLKLINKEVNIIFIVLQKKIDCLKLLKF